MKELLSEIIKSIVDKPESVTIEESENEGVIILMITVDKEDMGKVIGRGGKIIKSIRNVIRIKAIKEQKRVMVNLVDHAN
jgi:predicted RNA-binding protein YlqC (UPF0109 family)